MFVDRDTCVSSRVFYGVFFFFSSRRRHTRSLCDWSSDVCSSDLVTLEPCAQCAGAIVLAKVARLVFGAYDPKAGMAGSVGDLLRHPKLNHRVEVIGGVEAEACGELLRDYFRAKRAE